MKKYAISLVLLFTLLFVADSKAAYDPTLGRWLQRDPIGEIGGINLFAFVGNNPVNNFDPYGLQIGAGYGSIPLSSYVPNGSTPIEPPPAWATFIPFAGPGSQAAYDFSTGHWGWGTANLGLAVSDIGLLSQLGDALWKTGSHTWSATSKWLTKECKREFPGQEMHHWAIPQRGWGSSVPDWLKNQPWNLMGMPDEAFHDALHGGGKVRFSFGERLWYGTPYWLKLGAYSVGAREANAMYNNDYTDPATGN